MKKFVYAFVIGLTVLFIAVAMVQKNQRVDYSNYLPWNVKINAQGHPSVFGITLAETSLLEIKKKLNKRADFALMQSADGQLSLEAYYGQVKLGFLDYTLLGVVDQSQAQLQALLAKHPNGKAQPSGARKHMLTEADIYALLDTPLRSMTLAPRVDFKEDVIEKRFATPGEKIAVSDTVSHWIYPDMALEIIVDDQGKDLIQYFLPQDLDIILQRARLPVQSSD